MKKSQPIQKVNHPLRAVIQRNTKFIRSYLSTGIIVSALFLFSCSSKSTEVGAKEQPEESETIVRVSDGQLTESAIEIGKMELRQVSGTVSANGMLDVPPQQLVSISVPMGGFLKSTKLLQGSHVNRGEVIAVIENMDFIQLQQDYLEAKSHLQYSKMDYERQRELAKENVNSTKALQQAATAFEDWKAKHQAQKEKLKMLNIDIPSLESGIVTNSISLYAPISGYVTEVNTNIGKYVAPKDVMFEIVDVEHLHVELTVFEKDVLKIKIGQRVLFTLSSEIKERVATVFLIGREISPERTIRIHCHIESQSKTFMPGMYLKAHIETDGALVNALPDGALIDFQGAKYIFVLKGGEEPNETKRGGKSFEMMEVQIGNSEAGYTEVMPNEKIDVEKAKVAVKGAYALLSKMKNSEEE